MRYLLPFIMLTCTTGCIRKAQTGVEAMQLIQRDTDILNEEDLEELPEN